MTLNDVTATSVEPVILNSTGTVDVNGGDFKTTGIKSCFVNNSANLTIDKGTTTEGNFVSEGASCINNNWGQVRINGGSLLRTPGLLSKTAEVCALMAARSKRRTAPPLTFRAKAAMCS